jgi:hypothetical protein
MSEADIKRGVTGLFANPPSKDGNFRSDAETIGMRCELLPGTACSYRGEVVYRFNGLPAHSAHRNMQTILTIDIRLISYADLRTLVVRKEKVETPAK